MIFFTVLLRCGILNTERQTSFFLLLQSRYRAHRQRQKFLAELARLQLARENKAALMIQCRWRIKQGGFALHLKKLAQAEQLEDERWAATLLQAVWRGMKGRLLSDKAWEAEEARQLEAAALRIQCRWRIKQGGVALHLKKAARREHEANMERAAIMLQNLWRNGCNLDIFRKVLRLHRHEKRVAAAIRVQCRWRIKKGGLALHMKRQVRATSRLNSVLRNM